MKTFDSYSDGDWVTYINPRHAFHQMQFQAYKSKFTHNAFRLRYGEREVIADISEIISVDETNNYLRGQNEISTSDLPRGSYLQKSEEYLPESSDVQD